MSISTSLFGGSGTDGAGRGEEAVDEAVEREFVSVRGTAGLVFFEARAALRANSSLRRCCSISWRLDDTPLRGVLGVGCIAGTNGIASADRAVVVKRLGDVP
jgi:hypothetical protein